MEPITWATVATLIANVGYPLAVKIIDKAMAGKTVTPEEWASLKEEAKQMGHDRMLAMLKVAGVDPESAQGKVLLELSKTS